jgi:hypothetical protein
MPRRPDIKTDRIAIIQGGTFFGPDKDPCTVRRNRKPPRRNTSKPWASCKISRLKPRPQSPDLDDETRERREPEFEVHFDVTVGTVDELVEQYRRRLTKVFKTAYQLEDEQPLFEENDPTPEQYWQHNEEFQDVFTERVGDCTFVERDGAYVAVWGHKPFGDFKAESNDEEE